MKTLSSITDISDLLSDLGGNDWLIVDVDDTLITPKSSFFRWNAPTRNFIDEQKQIPQPDLPKKISTWRASREVQLVEAVWPEILQKTCQQGASVIALTKMDTGAFGVIPNMENWRASELNKMGLYFSNYAQDSPQILIDGNPPSTAYKGILFTGSNKKSEVLEAFLKNHPKPKRIIFIDDRFVQVEDIDSWCQSQHIEAYCYYYTATNALEGDMNLERIEIQKEFFHKYQWLEDDEADKLLKFR